jgi:hypothetical protein
VHRRLVEEREYGGSDVAAIGAAAAFEGPAEAAAVVAPASFEPATTVTVSVLLSASAVLVDSGSARIIVVVSHV